MIKPKKTIQSDDIFSSARFLNLNREWRERLKDAGFEDIEDEEGELVDEDAAAQAKKTLRRAPWRAEALAEYFTEAERALATTVFESPEDRAIWTHHARGSSIREIAQMMGLTSRTVQVRIEKYRRRLGLTRPR